MSKVTNTQPHCDPIHFLNQNGFQRLYLEYYSYLRDFNVEEIQKLYHQGLKYNLKKAHFNPENLRYIQPDLSNISVTIHKHQSALTEILEPQLSPESAQLQEQLGQCVNNPEEELETVSILEGEFIDHLKENPDDIMAEFNLAWLYFHLLNDYEAATQRFTQVADNSVLEDNPLSEMALRYLAMGHYFLGEHEAALASLKRAASLDQADNLYYLYEIAQQQIQLGNTDVATSHIKALIKQSPLYYLHIESDPFFTKNDAVDALLSRFHSARLESIKEMTQQKWNNSKLMQQDLPSEFNKQELFSDTFEEHLPLLSHQSYPLLCKTEQISTKIVKNLDTKAKTKLNSIDQVLTQYIQQEQKKWKIVNIAGLALVYFAVILTLASIFLFIGGDMFGLTSEERSIDWGRLVPQIFAAVVGTGVIGILLLQFDPPKIKALAKKKSLLTEAMD